MISRAQSHEHTIRMWAAKPIPHMKEQKKRHDISSKWQLTEAAGEQSAALYSTQWISIRWKWSCLGVWVIGLGGPIVGDVSEAQCSAMMLSGEQGMELLFQAISQRGGHWQDGSFWRSYIPEYWGLNPHCFSRKKICYVLLVWSHYMFRIKPFYLSELLCNGMTMELLKVHGLSFWVI